MRALVLGGGGVTGVAWEVGLLAGLAEAGIDVTDADRFVGTSAGAAVAAQITSGRPLANLYAAQQAARSDEIPARISGLLMGRFAWAMLRGRDPQRFRARVGAMALAAKTVSEPERRKAIASRVLANEWPDRDLVVTAVDTQTGEFVTFDRSSGVPLIDAVGASCAVPGVWPPVTINGRRYMDGGIRSPANADLAAGYQQVLIVAPVLVLGGLITPVARQAAELRAEGARVAVVSPSAEAKREMGRNVLDPAYRAPSARAGYAQAQAAAAAVREVWLT